MVFIPLRDRVSDASVRARRARFYDTWLANQAADAGAHHPRPQGGTRGHNEWRVSIIREKIQYLRRVVAPDKEAAIAKPMEEFNIEPARRFSG